MDLFHYLQGLQSAISPELLGQLQAVFRTVGFITLALVLATLEEIL